MRDVILFSLTLVLVIGMSITGYEYQQSVTGQLVNDYTGRISELNSELENFKSEQINKLGEQDKKLSAAQESLKQVDQELKSTSTELKTEINRNVQNIQSNIESVKQDNKQKLSQLTTQLNQVQVTSANLKKDLANLDIGADFSNTISNVINSVVSINAGGKIGSGAIVKSDGVIVTNNHVVDGAGSIIVKTFDGKTFSAQVVKTDSTKDLALIKISGTFNEFSFEDVSNIRVGEKAVALGSPGGLDFTVTEGIVSALRNINGINYLQVDVPINPGNSGGPLINKAGKIIGINTMKVSGFEGVGFSIASDVVKGFVG